LIKLFSTENCGTNAQYEMTTREINQFLSASLSSAKSMDPMIIFSQETVNLGLAPTKIVTKTNDLDDSVCPANL
jgi:hypothetical protein